MLDTEMRGFFQIRVVDRFLPKLGWMHPHLVTGFALLTGLGSAALVAGGYSLLAASFLALSGVADILDGSIARMKGISSAKGAVYDIVSDRAVEGAVILGLYGFDPQMRALLSLVMLFSVLLCIASFLVVGIFTANKNEKSFHYSPGLMERTEAFVFFFAMILLPCLFVPLACLFSALVLWTAFWRIWQFSVAPGNTNPCK